MANKEETRKKILEESLKEGTRSRFGYFSFAPPLCIADDSVDKKTPKRDMEKPIVLNFKANPPKQGMGPDAFFSLPASLAVGDKYEDPSRKERRYQLEKNKLIKSDAPFRPSGCTKEPPSKFEYIPVGPAARSKPPRLDDGSVPTGPRNFVTSPSKRGGNGVLTPGVLFSPYPEHLAEPYGVTKQLTSKDSKVAREKMPDQPFKGMSHGGKPFSEDKEIYHLDANGVRQARPASSPNRATHHDRPFYPSNPPRKGLQSTLNKFPEYIPQGASSRARNASAAAGKDLAAWRPNHGGNLSKPDPSVACSLRNLKQDKPAAFAFAARC
eukprot:GILJ01003459.1.p1 GENE.GILJ01003459.1~~GILJ01003459.1.p1  ORF type:complete len:325 (-),score=44.26 GILJ01003459.1:273-1247(-)